MSHGVSFSWRLFFSSPSLSEHLCFRCPSSSVWLQCHRQSAPSLRQARGADSRGGTVCHICYSCHQLQEAPHKWSGLRSSRGRPVSSHRNVQVCVCVCAHPSPTPSPPPPPPPSFAIRLLIVSVRHWKRVRAAQNTMQWFAKWQFLKGS